MPLEPLMMHIYGGVLLYSIKLETVKKMPIKSTDLGVDKETIPLVKVWDNVFPRIEWLIEDFNENTTHLKDFFFNIKLYSARDVGASYIKNVRLKYTI